MRRAAKKDANHNDIADFFKKAGCAVLDLSQLKNCCDMAITKYGLTVMIEVKDGSLPPSKRALTPGECEFRDYWESCNGWWELVETIEDAKSLQYRLLCAAGNV